MTMFKLVIAEKPSVALNIAAVLGAKEKQDGYYEGNGYLVSWCIGHLAELWFPDRYDEKYQKWNKEDLPILPHPWRYGLLPKEKRKQFERLKALMQRKDVSKVINACDAGREGERIFRTVCKLAGCKKPMLRLWISSMEDQAIFEGFRHLKPGKEYDGLYAAAECRARADWLIGMNLSRLFTVGYGRSLRVGRVVSPTLAFLTDRQKEIDGFVPEPFYTVELFDGSIRLKSEKIKDKAEAEALCDRCLNQPAVFKETKTEEKTEHAPLLYDLTALQRDANRHCGFTAQQTLDYAQALYEKKLCTYPRTDARYLTDDMTETAEALFPICAVFLNETAASFDSRKLCNSKKVTDHYAMIPTVNIRGCDFDSLPSGEQKILTLLAKRLLAAASEDCISETETAVFTCGDAVFTVRQTRIRQRGWKAFETEEEKEQAEVMGLSGFKPGDLYHAELATVKEGKTKPKAAYTEDTLLAAMETAGAAELPEDAERSGIGTPATRAEIIEKLVRCDYVKREGKKLIPQPIGTGLVCVLPEALRSAALTAEWETKLKLVERGKLSAGAFLDGITAFLRSQIEGFAPVENADALFPPRYVTVGVCPRCGGRVNESTMGYFCETEGCRFALWKDNRYLTPRNIQLNTAAAETLLRDGKLPVQEILSLKTGKPYSGILVLEDDGEKTQYRIELPPREEDCR